MVDRLLIQRSPVACISQEWSQVAVPQSEGDAALYRVASVGDYKLSKFKKILPELGQREVMVAGAGAMPPIGGLGFLGAVLSESTGPLRHFVLGLTTQRLLVLQTNGMGRPKKVLRAIPLADIVSAERIKSGKMSPRVAFSLQSGEQFVVQAASTPGIHQLETLLARMQPLLGQ
jgi:hypothetical protein